MDIKFYFQNDFYYFKIIVLVPIYTNYYYIKSKSEVDITIKQAKSRRATRPNRIHFKFLKLLDDKAIRLLTTKLLVVYRQQDLNEKLY